MDLTKAIRLSLSSVNFKSPIKSSVLSNIFLFLSVGVFFSILLIGTISIENAQFSNRGFLIRLGINALAATFACLSFCICMGFASYSVENFVKNGSQIDVSKVGMITVWKKIFGRSLDFALYLLAPILAVGFSLLFVGIVPLIIWVLVSLFFLPALFVNFSVYDQTFSTKLIFMEVFNKNYIISWISMLFILILVLSLSSFTIPIPILNYTIITSVFIWYFSTFGLVLKNTIKRYHSSYR